MADPMRSLGLTDLADARIHTLSGGHRRRLDIAIGLVGSPEILFPDEPTAGLDPGARREFLDLIKGVGKDRGSTVLITTHDLIEAGELADRILIMAGGCIIAAGTPQALPPDPCPPRAHRPGLITSPPSTRARQVSSRRYRAT
ncbi:ATP-binding cassette domain-containing protein [Pseudonocardia sp. GCM10023141]|uniref:ATP-binding cassette domain-containing protein n=1 Tax=Pseudonocardia sp. GCM10023141 TaxID=3252653 RepID=UPI00361D3422